MIGMLKSCGSFGFLTLFVASLAFAVTAASLAIGLTGKKRVTSLVAGIGLFLAGATGLVGFSGTLVGLSTVKAVLEAPDLTKADRARLQHQGSLEARDCSRLGIASATLPFVLGAIAATMSLFTAKNAAAATRVTEGEPDPKGPGDAPSPTTSPAFAPAPNVSVDGPVVPVVYLGAAIAFTGLLASGGLGAARVAGADYQPLVWGLTEKSEAVVAATPEARHAACDALELALAGPEGPGGRACGARIELDLGAVSQLTTATETCVDAEVVRISQVAKADRAALASKVGCSAIFASLPSSSRTSRAAQLKGFE